MENYRIAGILKAGESVAVRGCSDNNWLYFSSSDMAELTSLTEQISSTDKNFACLESWMLPLFTEHRKVAWKMSTTQFLLPEDVELSPESSAVALSPEDAPYIYQHLPYKDITSVKYIEERITQGESAGIYEQGRLVAWAATHDDGAMGLLQVLPQYRNRGYATEVLIGLIGKIRSAGKIPFGQIEGWNVKSLNLMAKLGFVPHKDVHWLMTK
ncbi:GNAT family N-acetyltransferase [Dethiobacter alkaliphilus]|uniref:GNAT family N-acetyltransferase n=1 Tax=Dethiobacter alkaliphilus TaxID=427926 RepID=UPI0022260FDA|nr:GNAT family N-acetyltransferase [Dethiobacter alkaliphilus]MCW3488538.1 GNAT family N-acetyltransferase [Dethiobacter alkaliphilus]